MSRAYSSRDFPGGAVVKNLPASAGDTGSNPGPGRSPMPQSNKARVPQLLSLSATTTEACVPRACALQQEKPPNMKPVNRNQEWSPLAATREKPARSNKDPRQPKIKIN